MREPGDAYPGPGAEPDPADEILTAPDTDRVLAQAGNNVYLVTLPQVGGETPSINVSDPSAAPFPVKRLSQIGRDFIPRAAAGSSVYWATGRSFFRFAPAVRGSMPRIKAAARLQH